MFCNAVGGGPGGGVEGDSPEKRITSVRFNIISVTRDWVDVKFPGGKRYVTLEWPLTMYRFP